MNSVLLAATRRLTRGLRFGKTIKTRRMKWLMLGWAIVGILITVGRTADSLLDTALEDTKLYFASPLRWDEEDWLYFGGALVAIGALTHLMREFATISLPARKPS
jgi:hypothetical protein